MNIVDQLEKNYKTNLAKRLLGIIAHTHFGQQFQGTPKHCNTAETIIQSYNRNLSSSPVFLKKLSHKKILAHQRGEETFYFCGAWRTRDKETLVMIDIDVQKSQRNGTPEGARAFANHLQTLWPDLYVEPSTNGKGMHGYLIVNKDGVGPDIVNQAISRLEGYLRTQVEGFDIELVEVKGSCPILDFGRDGKLKTVKAGTLAKIPRGDFSTTTKLAYTDLLKLPQEQPQEVQAVVEKRERTFTGTTKKVGSVSLNLISQDELGRMPHYREVATSILDQADVQITGRAKVTTEDVAIFLLLGKYFTNNMNDDGTLPYARFKGLWSGLYKAGDVARGFDDKRFAAIRNLLSSLSLIDWEDATFAIGNNGKGQACKWAFSSKLMELLGEEKRENLCRNKVVALSEICVLNPDYLYPVMRPIAIRPDNWYLSWTPDNLTTEVIAA